MTATWAWHHLDDGWWAAVDKTGVLGAVIWAGIAGTWRASVGGELLRDCFDGWEPAMRAVERVLHERARGAA